MTATTQQDVRGSLRLRSINPMNLELLDVNKEVLAKGMKPVRSMFIMKPGSDRFHEDGLFSEEIFGSSATEARLTTRAYVALNTQVLQPKTYQNLLRLSRLYERIMGSTAYAVFDKTIMNFVQANPEDQGADTGYEFFTSHVQELQFNESSSSTRRDRVEGLTKFKDILLIDKVIVIPAGLRDYEMGSNGRPSVDEINKFYTSLLSLAQVIPPNLGHNRDYDHIRFAIQRKLSDLYSHIQNIVAGDNGGKNGHLQRKWGSRNLTLGGRDVISASDMTANATTDLQFHSFDETKVPLFLGAKILEPSVIYQLRRVFLSHIMSQDQDQVSLINPKTFKVGYHQVLPFEKDQFLTPEGLTAFVNSFRDVHSRDDAVVLHDTSGVEFYLYLVYDEGDRITIFRNLDAFKDNYSKFVKDVTFDMDKVRPLSKVEMIAIATWLASRGKYVDITRYPAIGLSSTYPSRIHLITTSPARTVKIMSEYTGDTFEIGEYPILGESFVDSTVLHPAYLAGLGGDFDGDTISVNSILSDEACVEHNTYLNSPSFHLNPDGTLCRGFFGTDLMKLTLYNLMKPAANKK